MTLRLFQDRVLDMRRFLIRPSAHCENLLSRVLSMAAERVGPDFARRYGLEPWLLESFVNTEVYEGTCYQAANWLCVGEALSEKGLQHAGGEIEHHAQKEEGADH